MLQKNYILFLFFLSSFVFGEKIESKKEVCQKYKGKYISHLGTDVFFVTEACKRRKLDKSQINPLLKKEGTKVHQVKSEVIKDLPREKTKKILAVDVIKKYKGECFSSFDGMIYRVTEKGKKRYPDYSTAQKKCSKIIKIKDEESAVLLDDEKTYPSIFDELYKERKSSTELKRLDPRKVCPKMQMKGIYAYYSDFYRLEPKGRSCYLQKLSTEQLSQIMKSKKGLIPFQLTGTEYLSLLKKEIIKKDKKDKTMTKKGEKS